MSVRSRLGINSAQLGERLTRDGELTFYCRAEQFVMQIVAEVRPATKRAMRSSAVLASQSNFPASACINSLALCFQSLDEKGIHQTGTGHQIHAAAEKLLEA